MHSQTSLPVNLDGSVDTHSLFKTISHAHFDLPMDDGRVIELKLVECCDGRWFLEGAPCEWQDATEVCLNLSAETFRAPLFVTSKNEATQMASRLFKDYYALPVEDFERRFFFD